MDRAIVRVSPTSEVATFSPFHLRKNPKCFLLRNNKRTAKKIFKGAGGRENSPERVSDSVLEIYKVLVVKAEQVAGVEVEVAFLQDVGEPLLVRLLLVPRVARERGDLSNGSH